MDTQNQKGQALFEMTLVMSMFLLFWIFFQKSVDSQKQSSRKWKIGHDTKIQFKKDN
jgi:hypothetical protein